MNFYDYQAYLVPLLIVSFFVWWRMKIQKVKAALPGLIEKGAVIVDVRSRAEFQQSSRPGSVNIPLNEISARTKELDPQKTIVLCCASGTRSGVAVGLLKKNGFKNVVNAGSWTNTL